MTYSLNAPSRAVILAAGMGSRLRPFTDRRPKPLVEVRGVPILHNALLNLAAVGVKETTIVVGYRREAIEQYCGREFAGMRIVYVESDVFDCTGSAYSLWLAGATLKKGDALLLEGDVFFDAALLQRVLRLDGNVAAIDAFDSTMTGSAALLDPTGKVLEFRMNQSAATAGVAPLYKTVNIYRLTAPTLRHVILPALERVIAAGDRKCYVEQVLAQLIGSGALQLHGVRCEGVRWFEIDSEADLRQAERIFDADEHAAPVVQPQFAFSIAQQSG